MANSISSLVAAGFNGLSKAAAPIAIGDEPEVPPNSEYLYSALSKRDLLALSAKPAISGFAGAVMEIPPEPNKSGPRDE